VSRVHELDVKNNALVSVLLVLSCFSTRFRFRELTQLGLDPRKNATLVQVISCKEVGPTSGPDLLFWRLEARKHFAPLISIIIFRGVGPGPDPENFSGGESPPSSPVTALLQRAQRASKILHIWPKKKPIRNRTRTKSASETSKRQKFEAFGRKTVP